jgi:hypothetical protein
MVVQGSTNSNNPLYKIADDHIHFAVTDAQDLLVATKSSETNSNNIYFLVRWQTTGQWEGPYLVSEDATRPIVLLGA